MSVQVKGSGTIGGLDEGLVVSGIVTSSTQINVGSNIKIGNAGVVTATSFSGSGANLTNLPAQATIANNADNRIITGGSGVNLNGEANLTFTGKTLTTQTLSYPETTELTTEFKAGVENGNRYLNRYIKITNTYTGSEHGGIPIVWEANADGSNNKSYGSIGMFGDGAITFYSRGAGAAANVGSSLGMTEKLRIKSDGDVSILDGNLIVANGHGIDFNATANAQPGQYNSINPTTDSEVLHDYEFGSFTPHIRTQGGTSNATYAQKGGYYTKIGRMVYCTFFMNWSNATNHSGYIYFVGLPYFSGSNTATHLMYGVGTVQLNGFTISGNRNPLLHMGAQTSGTNLASNNSGGNSINEGHTNNGYIIANITYIANY